MKPRKKKLRRKKMGKITIFAIDNIMHRFVYFRDQSHDTEEGEKNVEPKNEIDQKSPSENDNRNGTADTAEEQCDKTEEPDATATDVLSSNAVTQQTQNNKNGKGNNKKNKKIAKGKLESPTSDEVDEVKA